MSANGNSFPPDGGRGRHYEFIHPPKHRRQVSHVLDERILFIAGAAVSVLILQTVLHTFFAVRGVYLPHGAELDRAVDSLETLDRPAEDYEDHLLRRRWHETDGYDDRHSATPGGSTPSEPPPLPSTGLLRSIPWGGPLLVLLISISAIFAW